MKQYVKGAEPNSVIEILLESDVYQDNIKKISNDLVVALFAGTDTSRNNTITTLCHLIKNSEAKEVVREEIKKYSQGLEVDGTRIWIPSK